MLQQLKAAYTSSSRPHTLVGSCQNRFSVLIVNQLARFLRMLMHQMLARSKRKERTDSAYLNTDSESTSVVLIPKATEQSHSWGKRQ